MATSPSVFIDYSAFPHIIDQILDLAPRDALFALRAASRSLRDRIDGKLAHHLVVRHCGDMDQKQWIEVSDTDGRRLPLFSPTAASTKWREESEPRVKRHDRFQMVPQNAATPHIMTYSTTPTTRAHTIVVRDDPEAWPDPPVHGDSERYTPVCLAYTRIVDVITNTGIVRVGPHLAPAFANIDTLRLVHSGDPHEAIPRWRQGKDLRDEEDMIRPTLFLAFTNPNQTQAIQDMPPTIEKHVMNITVTPGDLHVGPTRWESINCLQPRSAKEIVIVFHSKKDPDSTDGTLPTLNRRMGFGGRIAGLLTIIASRDEPGVQYTLVGLEDVDARYLGILSTSSEPQYLSAEVLQARIQDLINLIVMDQDTAVTQWQQYTGRTPRPPPLPIKVLAHEEYSDLVGAEMYAMETTK